MTNAVPARKFLATVSQPVNYPSVQALQLMERLAAERDDCRLNQVRAALDDGSADPTHSTGAGICNL